MTFTNFATDISAWDTSSVTSMGAMFYIIPLQTLLQIYLNGTPVQSPTWVQCFTGLPTLLQIYLSGIQVQLPACMQCFITLTLTRICAAWGPHLVGCYVNTWGMFRQTQCPTKARPDLTATIPGTRLPFLHFWW